MGDEPLYHSKLSSSVGEQDHLAYNVCINVVELSVNQRVQGLNQQQTHFTDLLRRIRTGDCNQEDWNLFWPDNLPTYKIEVSFNMLRGFFCSNEDVTNYNFQRLSQIHKPVACINARHASDVAKKATMRDKTVDTLP